jgi:hypothetical protein
MQLQQMQQVIGQYQQERMGKVIEQQGRAQVAQIQDQAETERDRMNNELKLSVAMLQGKFETLQSAMSLFLQERGRLGEQGHDVALGASEAQAAAQQSQLEHQQAMQQADQAHQQALAQAQQQASLQPPAAPPGGAPGGGVSQ